MERGVPMASPQPCPAVPPQSLDSLGTAEDARSKRHSTSDLSDVPFSAVRKEGWLHCKQILTKKGKVGGCPPPHPEPGRRCGRGGDADTAPRRRERP